MSLPDGILSRLKRTMQTVFRVNTVSLLDDSGTLKGQNATGDAKPLVGDWIESSGVTYEALNTNGDVGTSASTLAAGNDSRFLTSAQKTDLTDGGDSTAHYHTADRAATTLGGLSLNSTTRNDQANKVMRTNASGFANFGWINTTSGDTTSSLSRAFVNTGDGYIRMCTMAHLVSQIRGLFVVSGSFSGNNTANRVISTGLSKQTRIVWVVCNTGQQQWVIYPCNVGIVHNLASGSFQIDYNSAFRMNQSGYSYYWIVLGW